MTKQSVPLLKPILPMPTLSYRLQKTKLRGKKKVKSKRHGINKQESYGDHGGGSLCYKTGLVGDDWISYDDCVLWFHRDCVNLMDP